MNPSSWARARGAEHAHLALPGCGDSRSGSAGYGRHGCADAAARVVADAVVVVSARTDEREKVRALDAGADRLHHQAVRHVRTSGAPAHGDPPYAHDERQREPIAKENRFIARGLVIDYDKYRVYIDGRDAGLTQNEFKLVALLGRYAGRVLTYDYLIREIWGPNKAYDNQILRVNMANIRRKIEKNPAEPEYIFTEVGVGYRMIEGD